MSERAMPTIGPVLSYPKLSGSECHKGYWIIGADRSYIGELSPRDSDGTDGRANAALIVAAFNAATEARAMGFDPIGAVQALRSLLALLTTTVDETTCFCDDRTACGGTKPCWQCRVRETLAAARTREETP